MSAYISSKPVVVTVTDGNRTKRFTGPEAELLCLAGEIHLVLKGPVLVEDDGAIQADTAHAVALEREKAAAMVSACGDAARNNIFQGFADASRLWDLAASIRNGDHWKEGA